MTFRIGALTLPFMGRSDEEAAAAPARAQRATAPSSTGVPLIGRLGTGRQLSVLTLLLVVLLALDGLVVAYDARQATFGTLYVASVGKIRMLSQRIANVAQQASQGNLEAFTELGRLCERERSGEPAHAAPENRDPFARSAAHWLRSISGGE